MLRLFVAIFFLLSLNIYALDSTKVRPKPVKNLQYICRTSVTDDKDIYLSAAWPCDVLKDAGSCKNHDVIIGIYSRHSWWISKKLNSGWLCSYRCARVHPTCRWE